MGDGIAIFNVIVTEGDWDRICYHAMFCKSSLVQDNVYYRFSLAFKLSAEISEPSIYLIPSFAITANLLIAPHHTKGTATKRKNPINTKNIIAIKMVSSSSMYCSIREAVADWYWRSKMVSRILSLWELPNQQQRNLNTWFVRRKNMISPNSI